ncbi:MAG TPA: glycosyltransferase family 2 protein [Jatrophihabitantaceae bacterium]|jgi:N-acetylglucosaminyl-diphospho-decaprenol L-rhamnosyltransferase
MSNLTVVAVTYSPGEALAAFLDSLEKATTAPVDIVLADNGSVDGSVDAAVQRPGVRVVPTGGNVGYGRAVNVGVAASSGEFVVIANPDVVWEPGSLDELLAGAARWPRAGSLGPLIRTVEGTVYPSARALPSLGRGIGHALCGWWWPSNPWTAAYRRERGEPTEGLSDWLSGSCLLVRREAFDSVAGFDPAYFMYFEDVDLGERLGKAGWQNVYVPSAVVTHTGGHATSRDPVRMAAEHHRSAWIYIANHYRGRRWAPVRWMLRLGLGARSLLAKRVRSVAEGAAPQRR